jgi:hypothetical protein
MTYNRVAPRNGKWQHVKVSRIRKQKVMRWAQHNRALLRACDPKMPGLYNRKADTWRLLFAVAELAGSKWLQKATDVVTLLADEDGEKESPGVLLLADIHRLFNKTKLDRLASSYLVARLAKRKHRPWSGFKDGKPITARQVAELLRPFGISPSTQRNGNETFKGYKRSQFNRAFSRYFTGVSGTRSQPKSGKQSSVHLKEHKKANVTDRKVTKLARRKARDDVTDQTRGKDQKAHAKAADWVVIDCPHCCSIWGCERCDYTGFLS